MKVIATKQGFYGKIREIGDEFDVKEGEKASWFAPKAEAEKPKAEGKKQQGAE